MYPQLQVNFPAILGATAASFVFAWLWHGPLFGKLWMSLMGVPADAKPEPKMMMRSMGLQLLATFMTAYVLLFTGQIWRPSVWGAGADAPSYVYGLSNGAWIWIGFFVPMLLGAVAWENRPWKLFGLNAAYAFINLLIMAMILAYWR
jgi:Protein of unknown function (DUF1761)